MALGVCKDCENPVSVKAKKCPNCGCKKPAKLLFSGLYDEPNRDKSKGWSKFELLGNGFAVLLFGGIFLYTIFYGTS